MKVTEINISRKFNLGNYQTFDVSATASLGEGEDLVKMLHELEAQIMIFWSSRESSKIASQIGEKK